MLVLNLAWILQPIVSRLHQLAAAEHFPKRAVSSMARSSTADRTLNPPNSGAALSSSAAVGPGLASTGSALQQQSTIKAHTVKKRLSVLDIPHRQGQHNPSHQDSSQLQDILNPVRGVREALLRLVHDELWMPGTLPWLV